MQGLGGFPRKVLAISVVVIATVACSRGEKSIQNRTLEVRDMASQNEPIVSQSAPTGATQVASVQTLFAERKVERLRLVNHELVPEGITDPRVLDAMRRVPRHRFVPEAHQEAAYLNHPLPIGWGQTISQPFIVALMTQAARISPADRCLEIGTGSGYQAAILAELCAATYSIEYLPLLAKFAKDNLANLGYKVMLRTGDGYRGWPEAAPFDVILVTAAPDSVPQPLLEQLALKGRMVIPLGEEGSVQSLELWVRKREGSGRDAFEQQFLEAVRFVPFLGTKGQEAPPRH